MTATVDFNKITLMDALDLATLIEEETHERYLEFAEALEAHRTPEAAEFFRKMAGHEEKHGKELMTRRKELFGDAPMNVDRAMLWEIEAPDPSQARMFMGVRDALKVVLEAEKKAFAFFDQTLPTVDDPDVRTLFEELRAEEAEHQELVRKEIAKLPPDDTGDIEDYADPAHMH